jgi:hypothetical protein
MTDEYDAYDDYQKSCAFGTRVMRLDLVRRGIDEPCLDDPEEIEIAKQGEKDNASS